MIQRGDHLPKVPTSQQYRTAIEYLYQQEIITDNQLSMLLTHYRAPNHTISATILAKSVGYKSWRGANLQYGILGKKIREMLSYRGEGQNSYIIAYFIPPLADDNDNWLFIMHPELVTALNQLGWE